MRKAIAYLIAPVMKMTGFRFSKDYRYGITKFHALTYELIDTVKANALADLI